MAIRELESRSRCEDFHAGTRRDSQNIERTFKHKSRRNAIRLLRRQA
jgi:hypothetical protein